MKNVYQDVFAIVVIIVMKVEDVYHPKNVQEDSQLIHIGLNTVLAVNAEKMNTSRLLTCVKMCVTKEDVTELFKPVVSVCQDITEIQNQEGVS